MPVDNANLSRFAKVPFEVRIQLDRVFLRVSEILSLKPGSVVTLSKPAGDSFDVLIGGARIASAEAVVAGDSMSVRLTGFEGN